MTTRFAVRAHVVIVGAIMAVLFGAHMAPASAQLMDGATAVSKKMTYLPEDDASAWYWDAPADGQVRVGPVEQQVELPNPQRPGTLPIAYLNGEPRKLPALRFDLAGRGVPKGSQVTSFVLTIVEDTELGEAPTLNAAGRTLRACGVTKPWEKADEPELWEDRPKTSDLCAEGTRKEPKAGEKGPVRWVFDLSKVAAGWVEDPLKNHGVMFSSAEPGEGIEGTWQVNLKIPAPDDEATPQTDEAKETADRVKVTMAYVPRSGRTGGPGGAPGGPGVAPGGGVPGGLFPTGSAPIGGGPPAGDPPVAGPGFGGFPMPIVGFGQTSDTPWYVWLLIPLALVGAYVVHGALVETPPPARGAGLIGRVRRWTAARRGDGARSR